MIHAIDVQKVVEENIRLKHALNQVLNDPDYVGGVQYWKSKHDKTVMAMVELINAQSCHDISTQKRT
jgi:hypothetical protein